MKDIDVKGLLVILVFAALITILFLWNLKRIEKGIDNEQQIEEINNIYNDL